MMDFYLINSNCLVVLLENGFLTTLKVEPGSSNFQKFSLTSLREPSSGCFKSMKLVR